MRRGWLIRAGPKDPSSMSDLPYRVSKARVFVILLSYFGALVQGTFILIQYFAYPTKTSVFIERPSSTELPSISLCFFYELPELSKKTFNGTIASYPLSLAEINDRLPKIDDWIIECQVLNASSYQLQDCLSYYNYTVEYLSLYSKCYSYFESLPKQIFYQSKYVFGKWMVDITFNTSVIQSKRIGIYITHTYAELEESLGNPSFLQFDTEVNNQAAATFKRFAVRSLKPPYDTDCLAYEKLDCKHLKTCMRHCVMNVSYDWYQSWFGRSYVKLEPRFMEGHFNNRSEKELYAFCSEIYPKSPCNDYHYHAILTSEFRSDIQAKDTFRLSVAYPITPKVEVVFRPFKKVMDTGCFIAVMFYLWTGISFLFIVSFLSERTEKSILSLRDYFKSKLIFPQPNGEVSEAICQHELSLISDGWTKEVRQVRLNHFTSHGLGNPSISRAPVN